MLILTWDPPTLHFASLMVIFCLRWISFTSQGLVSGLADGFPGRSYFNAKYAGRQRFRSVRLQNLVESSTPPFVHTGSVGRPLTTLLSIAAHFCQAKIHPKKHESLLSQHWCSAGFIHLQNKRSRTCNCETSQTLWQRVKCVCSSHGLWNNGKAHYGSSKAAFLIRFLVLSEISPQRC